MKILVIRTLYTEKSTGGILLLDDSFFAVTLEDLVRTGSKVFGETAIPTGQYTVKLSISAHFGKVLPEILAVPGFSGVRIHGGNTSADSEGCILIANHRIGPDNIQGSMSDALVSLLTHAGGTHQIQILNAWRSA